MPSSLNRRKTCPITRRESEQLMDFFLNLPSTPAEKESATNNFNNNIQNSDCKCGHTRPMFMRSDSYRQATQKFSTGETSETMTTFKKEDYDRKKYMSLPVDTKSKVRPNKNNKKTTLERKNKLNRQKSGTVPSSDSDNNHTSPSENRKKKSVLRRTTERIIFKLRKDKKTGDDKKKSKENKLEPKSTVQRTSNLPRNETALGVDSQKGQTKSASDDGEIIEPKRNSIKTNSPDQNQSSPVNNMAPSKSPTNGRRFRSQVSREEITDMFKKILTSSAEVRDEPFKFPNEGPDSKRAPKRKDFSPVRDTSYADGIKSKKSGLRLDIVPFTPNFTMEERVTITEDSVETSSEGGSKRTVRESTTVYERTFSLEVDGDDEIDGRVESPVKEQTGRSDSERQGEGASQEPLSPTEQEKMIEQIAKRLQRIADDYVQRKECEESESPRGAAAAPLLSPNSRSRKLANDLVLELRKEGDRLSREMNLPDTLLPIVMDMVKQITYDHFKDLVKKALTDTIGWDQVAMYFYVSKAAIVMAGAGGKLALRLKDMAVRYFHEELSPWIYDRGGLETMLDETDSEVD